MTLHYLFDAFTGTMIEDNLFLGPELCVSEQFIMQNSITLIISLLVNPPSLSFPHVGKLDHLIVPIHDHSHEDLLSWIPMGIEFIKNSRGACLVHCYGGVSRSASLVIAFLCAKYQISYDECYQMVKKKRSCINPNQGFVEQIKLFIEMGYKLDETNEKYKLYLLRTKIEKFLWSIVLNSKIVAELFSPIPVGDGEYFQCCDCNKVLFGVSNIVHSCIEQYCILPMEWMQEFTAPLLKAKPVTLKCPDCSRKIGSIIFQQEPDCSCENAKYQSLILFGITKSSIIVNTL